MARVLHLLGLPFPSPSSILNDIWLRVTTLAQLVTIYSQARKASGVNNDAHRRSVYLFFKIF